MVWSERRDTNWFKIKDKLQIIVGYYKKKNGVESNMNKIYTKPRISICAVK